MCGATRSAASASSSEEKTMAPAANVGRAGATSGATVLAQPTARERVQPPQHPTEMAPRKKGGWDEAHRCPHATLHRLGGSKDRRISSVLGAKDKTTVRGKDGT
jgi:hypothetical protein